MVVVTSLTRSETDDQRAAKALALVEGADLLVAAGDREDALAAYRKALAAYEMLAASLTAAGDREGAALAAHRADLAIRKIRRFDAAYPGLSPYIRREKLNKNSELLRQNSVLVSEQSVQNSGPMPGETFTPAGERGSPRLRHTSPLPEAGHEVSPAETAAQQLALAAKIPVEAARGIVDATVSKPEAMKAASTKLLRPPTKFVTKDDITEDDLNNPAVLRAHIDFANEHKNTVPSTLDDDQAHKLRKARLVRKYDIDRRHMAKLQH